MSNFATYDTYLADLLNEGPRPRREEVTEIQDREQGTLLCYANPDLADHITMCVNHHEELVDASGELLAFCKQAHHDRTVMTRLANILAKIKGDTK